MKLSHLMTVAAVAASVMLTGCDNSKSTEVAGPPPAPPTAMPESPTIGNPKNVDYTAVPTTTVIDGKTVKLKKLPGGLEYYDIKVGSGKSPAKGQTVSVQYTGTLVDGTKFDSSYDHGGQPIDFPIGVGSVIPGWDEGVPSMKVGGKRRLVIPGTLAYGKMSPTPTIPSDACLVFDIELVAVK
jgi:peptidylprolyl isomerase